MTGPYWQNGLEPRLHGVIESRYCHGSGSHSIRFVRIRWADGRAGVFIEGQFPKELHMPGGVA